MNPHNFFAYLDISDPMIAWEVAIGRLKTSCDNNTNRFGASVWHYKRVYSFINSNTQIASNEFLLELTREQSFPNQVSRLQGAYFFSSIEDLRMAFSRWGKVINESYISEVEFFANKVTRVDSEWITHKLGDHNQNTDWMKAYWEGKTYGIRPLTEIIASGIGNVLNKNLKRLAYEKIMSTWPTSTPLLAVAMAIYPTGKFETIAQIKTAFLKDGPNIKGNYYIFLGDLDKHEEEILNIYTNALSHGFSVPTIQPSDPNIAFTVPDLSNRSIIFEDEILKLHVNALIKEHFTPK